MKRYIARLLITSFLLMSNTHSEEKSLASLAKSIAGCWKSIEIRTDAEIGENSKLKTISIIFSSDGTITMKSISVERDGRKVTNIDSGEYAVGKNRFFVWIDIKGDETYKYSMKDDELTFTTNNQFPYQIRMKKVEQVAADQPAPAVEPKPEGKEKPEPESEGRSR